MVKHQVIGERRRAKKKETDWLTYQISNSNSFICNSQHFSKSYQSKVLSQLQFHLLYNSHLEFFHLLAWNHINIAIIKYIRNLLINRILSQNFTFVSYSLPTLDLIRFHLARQLVIIPISYRKKMSLSTDLTAAKTRQDNSTTFARRDREGIHKIFSKFILLT